ncbi:MAG: O-antigen ligase family protein [Candidatus Riflebacteria bacterium]|nr:O-antigen ligase family protein [Candidatus Riflebacteria bacterium]
MMSEKIRQLLMLVAIAVWFLCIEYGRPEALFGSPIFDLAAALATALTVGRRRDIKWSDSLFLIMLSRDLHLAAMTGLETWKSLPAIVWLCWLIAWATAENDARRTLLLLFHAGLTFDAGILRSIGMGMTLGWEAGPLNAMLLVWVWRHLSIHGKASLPVETPARLCAIGIAWIIILHRDGPISWMTASWAMTAGTFLLFMILTLPRGLNEDGACEVILLGGLPLILAAIGTGLAEAGTGDFWALQKRFFAGGIHPNWLGLSAAIFLMMQLPGTLFVSVKKPWGGVIRGFCGIFSGIMLITSGSRAALLIAIITGGIFVMRENIAMKRRRYVAAAACIVGVPVLIWWLSRGSFLMEWVYNERFMIWRAALERIADHPWIGHGILSFGYMSQPIDPVNGLWAYDWNYPHAHQAFLEAGLTGGLPAVILVIAIIICWARRWSWNSPGSIVGTVLLSAGCLDTSFLSSSLSFLTIMAFAGSSSSEIPEENNSDEHICSVDIRNLGAGARHAAPEVAKCNALLNSTQNVIPPAKFSAKSWLGIMRSQAVFMTLSTMIFSTILGQIPTLVSLSAFDEALALLNTGKPDWNVAIQRCLTLSPNRIQARLQRLLWRLSTEKMPTEEDRTEAESLERMLPDYYLPRFISGRLAMLEGNMASATILLARCVELDARDTTGIRWGSLALAQFHSGARWHEAAIQALARGEWGPGLILDHSILGPIAAAELPLHPLLAINTASHSRKIGLDALFRIIVARVLINHGIASAPIPFENDLDPSLPEWITDNVAADRYSVEKHKSGEASLFTEEKLSKLGPAFLDELAVETEHSGNDELLERILDLEDARWIRRSKTMDNLDGMFRRAGLEMRRGRLDIAESLLERLDAIDAGNPWILERLGIIRSNSGRSDDAREAFAAALRILSSARLRPFISEGPRKENQGPTGDQWSFAFELAFRRFDPECRLYNADRWWLLQRRLEAALQ